MIEMNDKIDRLIFLDLDHVLTNTSLDNTSFLSYDPSKYMLSKINLMHLDRILGATNAKIVIASNWRKFKKPYTAWYFEGKWYESILEPFKKLYSGKIIDTLPVEHNLTKCECLELWFEDNIWFSKHGHYVILEDDINERYQEHSIYSKHLVLTDYHVGLTDDDASKAIAMLNR